MIGFNVQRVRKCETFAADGVYLLKARVNAWLAELRPDQELEQLQFNYSHGIYAAMIIYSEEVQE